MENIDERKHIEKHEVELERKSKGKDIYWTKYIWNKEQPLALVISNYPSNKQILQEDLTSILIKNEIISMNKFGGVIIANLFTTPLVKINEQTLAEAFQIDGMSELIKVIKNTYQVIFGMGSLANRYQVAADRIKLLEAQIKKSDIKTDNFYILVNGQHKPVHPLAIRNEHWKLMSWNRKKELMIDE